MALRKILENDDYSKFKESFLADEDIYEVDYFDIILMEAISLNKIRFVEEFIEISVDRDFDYAIILSANIGNIEMLKLFQRYIEEPSYILKYLRLVEFSGFSEVFDYFLSLTSDKHKHKYKIILSRYYNEYQRLRSEKDLKRMYLAALRCNENKIYLTAMKSFPNAEDFTNRYIAMFLNSNILKGLNELCNLRLSEDIISIIYSFVKIQ
jgi:hypothetical protein